MCKSNIGCHVAAGICSWNRGGQQRAAVTDVRISSFLAIEPCCLIGIYDANIGWIWSCVQCTVLILSGRVNRLADAPFTTHSGPLPSKSDVENNVGYRRVSESERLAAAEALAIERHNQASRDARSPPPDARRHSPPPPTTSERRSPVSRRRTPSPRCEFLIVHGPPTMRD